MNATPFEVHCVEKHNAEKHQSKCPSTKETVLEYKYTNSDSREVLDQIPQ